MRRKLLFLCIMLSCFIGITELKVEAKASETKRREYANVVVFAHFSGANAEADAQYFTQKENYDKILKYYNGNYGRSMTNYLKQCLTENLAFTIYFHRMTGQKLFPIRFL